MPPIEFKSGPIAGNHQINRPGRVASRQKPLHEDFGGPIGDRGFFGFPVVNDDRSQLLADPIDQDFFTRTETPFLGPFRVLFWGWVRSLVGRGFGGNLGRTLGRGRDVRRICGICGIPQTRRSLAVTIRFTPAVCLFIGGPERSGTQSARCVRNFDTLARSDKRITGEAGGNKLANDGGGKAHPSPPVVPGG